ncbi:hypothetical protein WBG78_16125 [Chryseolinea sp. T2]|uniref:hypothetical protein n=1 Tax=Chryseolinea sp. T2 TaxID=3129255 RepID=UPI0030778394
MKQQLIHLITICVCLLASISAEAQQKQYKWTGAWIPTRVSAADGITELDTKIGRFINLPDKQSHVNLISNINKKFPGSAAWATWTVGDISKAIPSGETLSDAAHESYLTAMDEKGITIFLEIFPFRGDESKGLNATNVEAEIDRWLTKFKHHKCIAGVGVELEYFGKATDELTALWDKKLKSHNSKYRLFLRHYSKDYMPPVYRGSGDLIFICDASEATIDDLNKGFAAWANHFAPTACAFQIGYPADEDGMNGSKELGWWRLKDPIKEWGDAILPLIKNNQQQIGLIWVTAKSGKSYNKGWDLTR